MSGTGSPSTYTIRSADQGKSIKVGYTAVKPGYRTTTVSSASKKIPREFVASTPRIVEPTGVSRGAVGRVYRVALGTWTPSPTKTTYQWYRSGKKIKRATHSSYTTTKSDGGKTLTVKVRRSRSGYRTTTRTSSGLHIDKRLSGKVSLRSGGAAAVGGRLTAARKGSYSPTAHYEYQWWSGTAELGTGASYVVQPSDAGMTITLRLVATRSGYTARTSSKSIPIPAA